MCSVNLKPTVPIRNLTVHQLCKPPQLSSTLGCFFSIFIHVPFHLFSHFLSSFTLATFATLIFELHSFTCLCVRSHFCCLLVHPFLLWLFLLHFSSESPLSYSLLFHYSYETATDIVSNQHLQDKPVWYSAILNLFYTPVSSLSSIPPHCKKAIIFYPAYRAFIFS